MPLSVLVVDDEPALMSVLATVLQDEGFTVRTAANGAEALTVHQQQPVDLIITDIMMPVMSGTALAQALRETGDMTPMILMSAGTTVRGATSDISFMRKPFDLDLLLDHVHDVLRTSRET
jgi:DNA-binding response OmpR family regulator